MTRPRHLTDPVALIEARNLSKSFPGATRRAAPVAVLNGISLDLQPGEMVAIVGPSGSGKSTLLYCLSGLEAPSSGSVRLMDTELSTLRRADLARLRRDHIGFVFQSFNLIPSLSARENVALPGRLAKRRIDRGDIDRALAEVGLTERARHLPGELSGGQQQRVAIARILAMRPDIVFADEPTGSLDTAAGGQVLDLLRRAAGGNRSVVMVTHDLDAAARADRVLVLRDGVIHLELLAPSAEQVFAAIAQTKTPV